MVQVIRVSSRINGQIQVAMHTRIMHVTCTHELQFPVYYSLFAGGTDTFTRRLGAALVFACIQDRLAHFIFVPCCRASQMVLVTLKTRLLAFGNRCSMLGMLQGLLTRTKRVMRRCAERLQMFIPAVYSNGGMFSDETILDQGRFPYV